MHRNLTRTIYINNPITTLKTKNKNCITIHCVNCWHTIKWFYCGILKFNLQYDFRVLKSQMVLISNLKGKKLMFKIEFL